jgi:hypothetical protein
MSQDGPTSSNATPAGQEDNTPAGQQENTQVEKKLQSFMAAHNDSGLMDTEQRADLSIGQHRGDRRP